MKKILIVDDDKRVVRMLEEYMKLYNFQTLCAGNGKDALALYDETVDLIILDINMQGMDGVEAVSYTHLDVYKRQLIILG